MKIKDAPGKLALTVIFALMLVAGCDKLRLAPSEIQKKNAYLHERATKFAADTAKDESTSPQLQALTELGHLQSKSYTAYFGLPSQLPQADSAADVLLQSNFDLAQASLTESTQRPDPWNTADALLELGIGISAIFGGVYGTRAVRFLKEAQAKSKALKEVIQGNELFKNQNPDAVNAFKQAQQIQSKDTKKLVTELKN